MIKNNNKWINNNNIYLNNCLPNFSSLNIDLIDDSDELILYCYQSSNKLNIVRLNNNLEIINEEQKGSYDINENTFDGCDKYYIYSLIIDTDNTIKILGNCDNNIIKYEIEKIPELITTIITYTTIPNSPTTLVHSSISSAIVDSEMDLESDFKTGYESDYKNEKNKLIIIQEYCEKSKEEIINNLNEFIKNYDNDKIYEIFGNDFKIKISPINSKIYKNISTFIDFKNCENIIREEYGLSSNFISISNWNYNLNENSLINEVEYAIFNKSKQLNLSICKDEIIEISYQIRNLTFINITKINYFSELGVDILNISDPFFNDICYPYYEDNSDLILKDRVSDIYENYSLCENNCQYNGINTSVNTISWECSIKTNTYTIVEPPRLGEIIYTTFNDSNLGVIKCY